MKINKNQSPLWVRIMVWVLVIGLVAGIGILGALQIGQVWNNPAYKPQQSAADMTPEEIQQQIATIDEQYQARIDELTKVVEEKPDDKTALVDLAAAYTNWGSALAQLQDGNAYLAAITHIADAREFWQRAYELDKTDVDVGGEYASSLYYSGETTEAITVAREVLEVKPDFGLMWYNLGQFLSSQDPQAAIEALESAIKYDADGTYAEQAQQIIDSLKGAESK